LKLVRGIDELDHCRVASREELVLVFHPASAYGSSAGEKPCMQVFRRHGGISRYEMWPEGKHDHSRPRQSVGRTRNGRT
jgi:hypothetical protein